MSSCDAADRTPCPIFFHFEFAQTQAVLLSGHHKGTVRTDLNFCRGRRFVPSSQHSTGSFAGCSAKTVPDRALNECNCRQESPALRRRTPSEVERPQGLLEGAEPARWPS